MLKEIKSMTGYGKSTVETLSGRKISVEIRSLNSKQADISMKMPSIYREKEMEARNFVIKTLQRGKIDVFVNVEQTVEHRATINANLFNEYFSQLKDLYGAQGVDVTKDGMSRAILRLPDVLQCAQEEVSEDEWKAFDAAFNEAIEKIEKFRIQEGQTLIKDILSRVDKIAQLREEITPFDEARIDGIKKRITESIEAANVAVDKNRFEQELIFYVEKLDITEEKVRLDNHIKYFHEVVNTEAAPGRKLGFIAQEMGREINTTGSKANNHEIQRIVVAMKDELEKIKEQSLNLL